MSFSGKKKQTRANLVKLRYLSILAFYREEKTEALLECKEELEHNRASLVKLKQEVKKFCFLGN